MAFGVIIFDFHMGIIVTVSKLLELIGGRIEKFVKLELKVKKLDVEFEKQLFR